MNIFRQHKWLTWTIVAVLVLAIAFAAVFGTIAAIRAAGAVMRYEGLTVSEGVYNYFTAYCKLLYIRSLNMAGVRGASDSPAFFARDRGDGISYGEAFADYTESYVRTLMVSAWLFDSVTSLTKGEKQTIKDAMDELVDFRADGSRKTLNEQLTRYGFTYDDLYTATVLQYKAEQLFTVFYGESGELVSRDEEACLAYYNEQYAYATLLFIRTEDKLLFDENGEPIMDENGEQKREPLTEFQKQQRAQDIATLDAAIENLATGNSPVITETMLQTFMDKYQNGDPTYDKTGWYFAKNATATEQFATSYDAAIPEAVLSASVGVYTKVTYRDGVCYLLRQSLPEQGYTDEEVEVFFTDFYFDCASELHRSMLNERTDDVVLTDRFDAFDHIAVPGMTNYDYIVRFS